MFNELEIVKYINEFGRGTIVDWFSWLISWRPFEIGLLLVVLGIIYYYDKSHKKSNFKIVFYGVLVALVIHLLFTELFFKMFLTEFFGIRERPYVLDNFIMPIGKAFTNSSFPSGHVSASAAAIFVICYFYRKKWLIATGIIFCILMALSRMHNGMHYPSDVIFGAVFGIIYGMIAIYLVKRVYGKKHMKF